VSDGVDAAREKHEASVRALQQEVRARSIVAPTNDGDVKARLRQIGEPICLFGEGVRLRRHDVCVSPIQPAERRDRLKRIMAEMEVDDVADFNRGRALSPPPDKDV
jgi:U4/U6 small nuclear ribonucleoprotein PRP4